MSKMFVNVGKKRIEVLLEAFKLYKEHEARPASSLSDMSLKDKANVLMDKFYYMARGKKKGKPFIKSVALQRDNTTTFPQEKRHGKKECARRLASNNYLAQGKLSFLSPLY